MGGFGVRFGRGTVKGGCFLLRRIESSRHARALKPLVFLINQPDRPAEDRKSVKDVIVEMTRASRGAAAS